MRNRQTRSTLDRLVGRWESSNRDSSAVFEIAAIAGKLTVTGFDSTDGERFKISHVVWDGRSLSFTAVMPSTRFRSKHKFTVIRAGVIDHELTVIERWRIVVP